LGLGPKNSNGASELIAALKRSCLPLRPWRCVQLAQHDRESNAKLVFPCLMKLNNPESPTRTELTLHRLAIKALLRVIRERVAFWKERSKIKYAIVVDENSKYFHIVTSNYLK
jgi:hypothetical protein